MLVIVPKDDFFLNPAKGGRNGEHGEINYSASCLSEGLLKAEMSLENIGSGSRSSGRMETEENNLCLALFSQL